MAPSTGCGGSFPLLTLPATLLVCYKPCMRKWMRDRLKRKKKTDDTKTESGPAPLQPAYFDAGKEPAPNSMPPSSRREEPSPQKSTAAESPEPVDSGDEESTPVQAQGSGSDAGRPVRRRRSRGGRGRGRGGSRPPAAPSPTDTVPEAAVAAPVVAPPAVTAQPHTSKGVVVLAIGLPGSGKSSWFKRHNITALSSDLLRSLLFDDANEQRFQDLVFSNLRSMLKARLIARRPISYVDATNLTPQERHSWIKLAKDFQYDVQAVYFDVPLEVCLERNQKRARVVGEDVVKRMSAKLKPPTFEEGFTKITVVRVKKKDSEIAEEAEPQ
jgi:predicted kinase